MWLWFLWGLVLLEWGQGPLGGSHWRMVRFHYVGPNESWSHWLGGSICMRPHSLAKGQPQKGTKRDVETTHRVNLSTSKYVPLEGTCSTMFTSFHGVGARSFVNCCLDKGSSFKASLFTAIILSPWPLFSQTTFRSDKACDSGLPGQRTTNLVDEHTLVSLHYKG